MFFQSRNSHTGPFFEVPKILKSFDKKAHENCIFIGKSLKGLLPPVFNSWFKFFFGSHYLNTKCSNLGFLWQIFNVCKCIICLESLTKFAIKISYFISWEKINWERYWLLFPFIHIKNRTSACVYKLLILSRINLL